VVGLFHDTEETIHGFRVLWVFIGDAEIEKGLDFLWEGGKFNENVLVMSEF
jgi:hypothetical protein